MKINKNIFGMSMLSSVVMITMSLTACSTMPIMEKINKVVNPSSNKAFGIPSTQRTLAQRLQDESIENTAKANLKKLKSSTLGSSRIEVDSFDNTVLVTGEVADNTAKEEVQKVIASMPEVNTIYNELKVERQHSLSYKVHDAYINSKLTQKIMRSKEISISQVDITTENGVVYVMGRVTEYQQRQLIELANQTQGILELVLLTTIVADSPQQTTARLTYLAPQNELKQQVYQAQNQGENILNEQRNEQTNLYNQAVDTGIQSIENNISNNQPNINNTSFSMTNVPNQHNIQLSQ